MLLETSSEVTNRYIGTTASANITQAFDAEGISGQLFAYAVFDDGYIMDISHEDLELDIDILDYERNENGGHILTVPRGAERYYGRPFTFQRVMQNCHLFSLLNRFFIITHISSRA